MLKKPVEELGGRELHRLLCVAVPGVAIGKGDEVVLERKDAVVRDGNAMGVGGEIREHMFGSAERRLDVAVPVGLGGENEQEIESLAIRNDVRRKNERARFVGLGDGVLDESTETPRENLVVEQKGAGGNAHPAAAIEREAAAGNEAMNVRVKQQHLGPGVKHGEDAEDCP